MRRSLSVIGKIEIMDVDDALPFYRKDCGQCEANYRFAKVAKRRVIVNVSSRDILGVEI